MYIMCLTTTHAYTFYVHANTYIAYTPTMIRALVGIDSLDVLDKHVNERVLGGGCDEAVCVCIGVNTRVYVCVYVCVCLVVRLYAWEWLR